MSEMLVRSAVPGDVDRVCEIAVTAWEPIFDEFRRSAGDAMYETLYPQGNQCKDDELRRAFQHGIDHIIVTECDGVVAGFATYYFTAPGVGEVGNNAVHPHYQGRGVGSAQMAAVLQRLRDAGCEIAKVFTGMDPSHAPARAMYEKAGFRQWWQSVTYIMEL